MNNLWFLMMNTNDSGQKSSSNLSYSHEEIDRQDRITGAMNCFRMCKAKLLQTS